MYPPSPTMPSGSSYPHQRHYSSESANSSSNSSLRLPYHPESDSESSYHFHHHASKYDTLSDRENVPAYRVNGRLNMKTLRTHFKTQDSRFMRSPDKSSSMDALFPDNVLITDLKQQLALRTQENTMLRSENDFLRCVILLPCLI